MELLKQKYSQLWIIEEDSDCAFIYQQILDIRYKTTYFDSIINFENNITSLQTSDYPDLLVLNLGLNNFNLLHMLKKEYFQYLNFIVVSCLDDLDLLRFCFQKGAKDYIIKPFKKNEIIVKIERSLPCNLDTHKFENLNDDDNIIEKWDLNDLTQKEMNMLKFFLKSKNKIVYRSEIVESIWKNIKVHPKALDVHLHNLRKKISKTGLQIRSCPTGGWTLLEDCI
ncbi:MAG: winged helix-turn-helix domain-containing protein [Bacteriovoracaceae bacterium]|nr:winged helix-turn-helix domain-containing protein [Bacteriovoracaceae bacterium]